jgi:nucleotide-binding universal stress UspA family protein
MKKVLIALDYNPSAEKVAALGYEVARSMNAEITLVHVITDPTYYALEYSPIMGYQGSYTDNSIALVEDIKKEAEKFLTASVNHLGNSNIKTAVIEGETTDSILQYALDWGADLIVMGSHTHTGLERLLVTDVAADILKRSKIPLLTIPTDEK